MGDIVLGTCSWTDPTMSGTFYPPGASSAEAKLRYYAERFDTVEVDSTFYGLPRHEYAENWARRTPDGFTFHVKAHGLMTGHEVDERSLHPELRGFGYDLTARGRVTRPEVRMVESAFEIFVRELEPLRAAGKLGGVLMQYPPYFTATTPEHARDNMRRIERDAELLEGLPVFVEFRHRSWVEGDVLAQTLGFLADRGLTYVAVDAPQLEVASTMPPISAATASFGYVRLHGRNAATWSARTVTAADRFEYLYDVDELAEWKEPLERLAGETERTWVMFNNCKYDYAPKNAREMAEVLGDVVAPRRGGALTGEPVGDDSGRVEGQSSLFDL